MTSPLPAAVPRRPLSRRASAPPAIERCLIPLRAEDRGFRDAQGPAATSLSPSTALFDASQRNPGGLADLVAIGSQDLPLPAESLADPLAGPPGAGESDAQRIGHSA